MRKHKIAIQGTEASFHHLAAKQLFGEEIILEHCNAFESVCQKIVSNEVDYGVMAIENLLTGCILTNYHLIQQYGLNIIGETTLPIELHLMGMWTASLDSIERVVSHPVALAQCNQLIVDHQWEAGHASDTASSAETVSVQRSNRVAAIANRETAELHGLTIIQENVQDTQVNRTRFLVLSRTKVRNENADKGCISFQLKHEKGQLSTVLEIMEKQGMNLTKIQSVPIVSSKEKYNFIVELEWSTNTSFEIAMNLLRNEVIDLSILGVYLKNEITS